MPLNDIGMVFVATELQTKLMFAQLHSGIAGAFGTDNIAVAGRQLIHWTTPAASFGLISVLSFIGGTPGGPAYSITLWDTETDGVYYGENPLGGDNTFNAVGEFQVTAIDVTGTTT